MPKQPHNEHELELALHFRFLKNCTVSLSQAVAVFVI